MITQKTKNFSTATLAASLAIWGLIALGQVTPAFGQDAKPGAKASGKVSTKTRAAATDSSPFTADTPDQYTVVKGDTLWGIAGRFLKSPWRWPEVWQKNRDQIKNPHWIYPGQVIIIDKVHGTMRLGDGTSGPGGEPTVELHPSVRVEGNREAISSIPQNVIEPFLTRPLVVDDAMMRDAPRIIAAKGDRVVLARGDSAYIAGITDTTVRNYQIFRQGIPLKDPDTDDILGYQADYVGSGTITHEGTTATLLITSFSEEINLGDRLVPAVEPRLVNYMPHAPDAAVHGRIVNTYTQVGLAGRGMVVALNRGAADGLDVGTILAVQSKGRTVEDRTNGSLETRELPDERIGLIFVFRMFDHLSYALVMEAETGVERGDVFTQP
jgi:hypothetical protein